METKRKKVSVVLIFVMAVIIVLSVVGVGYSMMITNMSAKNLYLKAESHTWAENWQQMNEDHKDLFNLLEEMLNADAVTNEENVSLKLDMENAESDAVIQQIQEEINRLSLHIVSSTNQKDNKSYNQLRLFQDHQPILSLEVHQSPEYTGLRIKELYDSTLKLKNSEFGQFMRQFDPEYNDTESLYIEPANYKDYIFKEDERKYLKEKYGKFLYDAFKEEYFTKTKRALKLEKDGEVHELDQISLKLSEAQVQTLLTNLLGEVKQDEQLYAMFETRMLLFFKMVGEENNITKEEIKEGYNIILEDMLEGVKSIRLPNGFVSNVFINGDHYIEKREIIVDGEGAQATLSFIDMPLNHNQSRSALNTEVTSDGEKLGFKWDEKRKDLTANGEMELYWGTERILLTYDGVEDKNHLKMNYDVKYVQEERSEYTANGTIDMLTSSDSSEVSVVKIGANVKTPLQNFRLDLNYDYKITFTDAGTAFEKEVQNGKDVLTIDAEEWAKIQEEVMNRGFGILSQTGWLDTYIFE